MKSTSVKRGHLTPKIRKSIDNRGIHASIKVIGDRHSEEVRVVQVQVKDGYHQRRYRLERFGTRAVANRYEKYLAKRQNIDFAHKRNRARRFLYGLPSFRSWSELMPTSLALEPMQHPELRRLPNGKRLGLVTRRWFRHGLGAAGIRSRTLIAAWLAKVYAGEFGKKDKVWVSLSGGTASPSLLMVHASGMDKANLHFVNVDIDERAVGLARETVVREGISLANTDIIHGDIFDKKLITDAVKPGTADVVDIMGVFEYLDDKKSAELLKLAYSLLKPGGVILACNMRSQNPQLNLHQRGIGWPGVTPRSVGNIKSIVSNAKLIDANLSIYQPGDGVYSVFQIKKATD